MKRILFWILGMGMAASFTAAVAPPVDFVSGLREKLREFYENRNHARIRLVLNQPEYLAGDTAYFKAYLFQGTGHKASVGKQIVNVQIINEKQKVILYNKVTCSEGKTAGQLILPENIAPGIYSLIAYVDFKSQNGQHPLVAQREFIVGGEKKRTYSGGTIGLFPEGGHWVKGIRTKVIARIPGKNVVGRVMDSSGSLITEFTTGADGLGSFFITPDQNRQYLLMSASGSKPLPEPSDDGAGIAVEHGQSIKVTVQVPGHSRLRLEDLYLVLSVQGAIAFSKAISFQQDSIYALTLPSLDSYEGIGQLNLFTAKNEVVTERLVFLGVKPVDLEVSLDAKLYEVRKPVRIDITSSTAVAADVSISVYNEALFATYPSTDLQQRILLEDDLVPDFNPLPPLKDTQGISDYLITRQWGTFNWNEILEGGQGIVKAPRSTYYFSGQLISRKGKAIPDSTAITFYLNKNSFVYVVYTRENGQFDFPLFMDFSNDELFYVAYYHGKPNKDAYIRLPATPEAQWPLPASVQSVEEDPYFTFSKTRKPIQASYKYYTNPSKGKGIAEDVDDLDDFDVEAELDKYKGFVSMPEVLVEVVPALKHKRVDNREVVRVFRQESAMFAADDPIYFIDGVITDSTAYFLAMDPNQVDKIRVLRSEKTLRRFGDLGKNGIVVVLSKNQLKASQIPRSQHTLHITGVTPIIHFHHPVYTDGAIAFIPDLRTTLYWQPGLKTDADGKASTTFYTGDAVGTFLVKVEGVTETGQPISKWQRFSVSMDKP